MIATIETIHHLVTIVVIHLVAVDTIARLLVVVDTVVGMVDMVVALRLEVVIMAAHLLVADIGLLPVDTEIVVVEDTGIVVVEDTEIVVVEDMEIVVVEEGAMKRFRCWFGI